MGGAWGEGGGGREEPCIWEGGGGLGEVTETREKWRDKDKSRDRNREVERLMKTDMCMHKHTHKHTLTQAHTHTHTHTHSLTQAHPHKTTHTHTTPHTKITHAHMQKRKGCQDPTAYARLNEPVVITDTGMLVTLRTHLNLRHLKQHTVQSTACYINSININRLLHEQRQHQPPAT